MRAILFFICSLISTGATAAEQEIVVGNPDSQNTLNVDRMYIISPAPQIEAISTEVDLPASSDKTFQEIEQDLSSEIETDDEQ